MDVSLTFNWHDTQVSLDGALAAAPAQPGHAVVSARLPLLADLTVAENIALPRTYFLNVNATLAQLQGHDLASRLLPADRAHAYPNELSLVETFAVLWLRAVALPGQVVVLDSPLSSFDLSESALRECAARCHGLYRYAIVHERRAQTSWGATA